MALNLNEIKELQAQQTNGSNAGQDFTPKRDRAAVKMTTKAELCKILNVSIDEFEAYCKKWSIVIDENYVPAQVAAMRESFGMEPWGDRPAAPTDLNQVAQSEAMTIRESVNL